MAELRGEAKRRYVANLFAAIAPTYDLMNTLMTGGLHHRWRRIAAEIAAKDLDGIAFDLASGTGDFALALAPIPGIKSVVGLDLTPGMVVRANEKAEAKGLGRMTHFTVGDGMALPFPDGVFACAVSGWGFRNMPDLPGALAEAVRVVKPGGRVVSLESTPTESRLMGPPFRVFFNRVVPLMGQIVARNREAYTYLPKSVGRFHTAEEMARTFTDSGLTGVGYKKLGFGAVAIHWGVKA